MQLKTCSKCRQEKELEKFSKEKRGKFGRKSYCKHCEVEYNQKYYQKNAQKIIKKTIENREGRREEYLQYLKDYQKRHETLD